ncbi:hypothetical protein CRG98_027054 [Punica granatum]|uniref:Plant bHLH transcription factor ACT-like domain-containing protein n=1 Tax=Punica granatum TaxID=22663 RepID=A0A2I0J886_PUNGR|nr:hypothetical protein CRG98_027054 [Punica granatum]
MEKKKNQDDPMKHVTCEKQERNKKLNDSLCILEYDVPKPPRWNIDVLEDMEEVQSPSDLWMKMMVVAGADDPLEDMNNLGSSMEQQTTKVEVRALGGRSVSIHLSCPGKRGLILSVTKALDNLGLDMQEGSIYNSIRFTFDVSRAEFPGEQITSPEHVKSVLLNLLGINGTTMRSLESRRNQALTNDQRS